MNSITELSSIQSYKIPMSLFQNLNRANNVAQINNATDMLITNSFRDLAVSASSIAKNSIYQISTFLKHYLLLFFFKTSYIYINFCFKDAILNFSEKNKSQTKEYISNSCI